MLSLKHFALLILLITFSATMRVFKSEDKTKKWSNGRGHYVNQIGDPDAFEVELKNRLLQASTGTDLISTLANLENSEDVVTYSTMNPNDGEFSGALNSYLGVTLKFHE